MLAFAGRILDGDADQPKYINSPETTVYHKKEVLYGLHQAKRSIRQTDVVMLVEGYTDVISLSQADVGNVVASSGTALTEGQIETLERYATRALLLYDADEAGGRAAMRGMKRVLKQGMGAYAVELPEGSDPDAFVQSEGGDAFAEYVAEHRQDLPSFAYQRARRAGDLNAPEDRVEVQRQIIEAVAQIPDPNLRREYVRRTSEVAGVPDADLFRMLDEERERLEDQSKRRRQREARREEQEASQRAPQPAGAPAQGAPASPPSGAPEASSPSGEEAEASPQRLLPEEKVLLRLMLEHGTRMVKHVLGHMALDEFTEGPARELVKTLVTMYQNDRMRPKEILSGEHGEALQRLAAAVMMNEHEASKNWAEREDIRVPRLNDRPYEAAESAMKFLKLDRVEEAIDAVREQAYAASRAGDEDRMQRLQQKMMSLQELRKSIKRGDFLDG
ncbi:MAG: toprim domain-containing protein [Salinibacter sp.]